MGRHGRRVFKPTSRSGMIPVMSGPDWGSVPTWVATLGALTALYFTGHTFWLNRQREIREQASKVAAWVYPDGRPTHWLLAVQNRSDLPVYEVKGRFGPDDAPSTFDHAILEPTDEPIRVPIDGENPNASGWIATTVMDVAYDGQAQVVPIEFRDSFGRMWRRDQTGMLEPIPPKRRGVRNKFRRGAPDVQPAAAVAPDVPPAALTSDVQPGPSEQTPRQEDSASSS